MTNRRSALLAGSLFSFRSADTSGGQLTASVRYGVAIIATLAALLLKLALGPVILPSLYVPFYGAVLVSAWVGGIGPGVVVSLLSFSIGQILFSAPPSTLPSTEGLAWWRDALFLFAGIGLSWGTAALHASQRRAAEMLRAARDRLDARVALRTAELTEANQRLTDEIAHRVQAEASFHNAFERLEASERRFRGTFEQAAVGIAHVAPDGRFLRINDRFCELVGYTRQEMLQRTFQVITHPADLDTDLAYVRQMLEGQISTYAMEKRYIAKDGSQLWADLFVSLVRDAENQPDYFIAVVQDISRRKEAQQALRERETQFRTLAETVAAATFIFQGERMLYANPAAVNLSGYSEPELLAMRFWDVIHPEYRERVQQRGLARQRGDAVPVRYEIKILTKQGEERWVDFTGGTIQFDGQPAVLGTAFDITERKRAGEILEARVAQRTHELSDTNRLLQEEINHRNKTEAALRESEQRFRAIFEQAAVGVSMVHPDGQWIMVNDRLCEILGYSRDELLQRTFRDVTHPDDREAGEALIRRVLNNELQTHRTEKRYIRRDGGVIWANLTASALRAADGTLNCGIAVVEDITARKQAESELRTAEERLRRLVEHLPAITYVIALDAAQTALYISPQVEATLGFTPAEWQRDRNLWVRQLHPDDRDRVIAELTASHSTGAPFSSEYRMYTRDGTLMWFHDEAAIIRDVAGQLLFSQGVMIDITHRKRAEEELAAANQRTRDILEEITDGFYTLDLDGHFTYLNPSASRLFERSAIELLGKNLWEAFPEGRGSVFEERYQRLMTERVPVSLEQYYAPRNRWYRIHAYPTQQGCSVLFEDVTERHQQEAAVMSDILGVLNAHLEVADTFPAVAAGLRALTGCDHSSIFVFEDGDELVQVLALDEPRADLLGGVRLRIADVPAAQDLLEGRPHVVHDLAGESRFEAARWLSAAGYRSWLSVPLQGRERILGILNLLWCELDAAPMGQLEVIQQVGAMVALALEKSHLFEEVRSGRERLEALSQRLLQVQEAERQHIARELHDEIGQALTALKLSLDTVRNLSLEEVSARLDETRGQVDELLGRVRNLALDLRPAMLDDLGLLPALVWLLERYSVHADMHVNFEHRELERRFHSEIETAAYRIVQEALTNVTRHAGVQNVTVRAWSDTRHLCVQIVDQGTGFDAEAALAAGATSGVAGMRERALLLGGHFTVESAPGKGTRVSAELPTGEPTDEVAACP